MALFEYDLEQTNGFFRVDVHITHSLYTELFLILVVLLDAFLGTVLDLAKSRTKNQIE